MDCPGTWRASACVMLAGVAICSATQAELIILLRKQGKL